MEQPEARFKRRLVEAFGDVYPKGWCAYLRALGKDGVPDLRFVIPGMGGLWVEAKAEEKPYSPVQRLQMTNLSHAGDRVVGLRCRGLEHRPLVRKIHVERPHAVEAPGVILNAAVFTWGMLQEPKFWTHLYTCGVP